MPEGNRRTAKGPRTVHTVRGPFAVTGAVPVRVAGAWSGRAVDALVRAQSSLRAALLKSYS